MDKRIGWRGLESGKGEESGRKPAEFIFTPIIKKSFSAWRITK